MTGRLTYIGSDGEELGIGTSVAHCCDDGGGEDGEGLCAGAKSMLARNERRVELGDTDFPKKKPRPQPSV